VREPNPVEEDRLVLLAIGGDDDAFSELMLRRQAWLRGLLRRLSGDDALADDLCQSALLKAWRRVQQLKDHRTFAAWLRQIAVRTWIDHARTRTLRFDDVDPDLAAAPIAAGDVRAADERIDLQTALATLRPAPRACIILFHAEGMSHSEVATATGLSIGVVKSHIARSTSRLRQALQHWRPS
jgi:RNA polymerase sigma-70 factor (ECF subfamily)